MKDKLRAFLCVIIAFVICFGAYIAPPVSAETGYVYVGGYPVGICIDMGGLLIESICGVETEYGTAYVQGLLKGDVILSVNGTPVPHADDISELVKDMSVTIELLRDGEKITVEVTPIIEEYTNKPKLGVKIKDKLYGVGTVTFVREDGRYSALGHEIFDSESGVRMPFCGGSIHACKLIGIKQGKKGEAGAILASVVPDKIYGSVTCNNCFGIAGKYEKPFDMSEKLPIGNRDDVALGEAKIKTTVGSDAEYFDIEIIKASKQSGRKEKGLVFRVTDKRLLDITGGVVRGMSGSPIIQNGKLIGAVTHVFLNDFTKGYGVFADCLN